MSRRIAHRPRHHNARYLPQPLPRSHKDYYHHRWTYRRLAVPYQKRKLGQGLLLLPLGSRFVHSIALPA